jgi:hypothetical protein
LTTDQEVAGSNPAGRTHIPRNDGACSRRRSRGPSIPDLVVAAIAELAGLVVLHVDEDFELIAEITGQRTEKLAAAS